MSETKISDAKAAAIMPPDEHIRWKEVHPDVLSVELAAQMTKRTDKLADTTIDLAIRLKQAREFMEWSTHHIRTSWVEWQEQSNLAARDINQTRMAFERETKIILGYGKDVREFFNSEDYLKSHGTMMEMISMLERFSAMKANGTLDAFADFILKVKCT